MSAAVTHRIGDLCEQVRGVTYSKADAVLSPRAGFKPVLRANNITERGLTFEDLVYVPAGRIAAKQFVRQNDVVVAASSGSIDVVGKAARALGDFDGGFGAFCKVLRPNGKVDPGYFAHFFQTQGYRGRVSALAAGANINNLRNEHLDELEVALPPPAEQRRIAAILDKADALRAKRREAIAKLDQLLQAVFLDMFGDPVSNPKGWPARTLEDVTEELKRGPFGGALKKEIFVTTGYAVYEQQHAIYGDFADVRYFIDAAKFDEMKAFSVTPGNLIVSCSGTMGKVAVVPGNAKAGVINQALLRITPNPEVVRGHFLADVLRSESMQTHLFGISRGSGLKNFPPMADVRELQIICPPVSLQERYLKGKSSIEALRALHTEAGLDRLFEALQRSAFSGGL